MQGHGSGQPKAPSDDELNLPLMDDGRKRGAMGQAESPPGIDTAPDSVMVLFV
jgi:hypothetical protein